MLKNLLKTSVKIIVFIGLYLCLTWLVSPGLFGHVPKKVTSSPVQNAIQIQEKVNVLLDLNQKIRDNLQNCEVGYWKLDGNINEDLLRNNGSAYNITFRQGIIGQAANFDGKTSYIEIYNNDALNFSKGNFTYTLWVKPNELIHDHIYQLLSKRIEGGGGYELQISDNSLSAYFTDNQSRVVCQSDVILDKNWHFVIVSRQDNIGYLYLDGELINKSNTNADVNNRNSLYIGRDIKIQLGEYFNGLIDEVHLYNCGYVLQYKE